MDELNEVLVTLEQADKEKSFVEKEVEQLRESLRALYRDRDQGYNRFQRPNQNQAPRQLLRPGRPQPDQESSAPAPEHSHSHAHEEDHHDEAHPQELSHEAPQEPHASGPESENPETSEGSGSREF